jgi:hypothetical protein
LAIAVISAEPVLILIKRINAESKGFTVFRFLGGGLILIALVLSISLAGGYSREKSLIQDVDIIGLHVNKDVIISINDKHRQDWSLIGYFQRKYGIGLEKGGPKLSYMLIDKSEKVPSGYSRVALTTFEFDLLRLNR